MPQAGYGYYHGTIDGRREHCPPVSKVIVELRPLTVGITNPVAKDFLPVHSVAVDLVSRSVTSAPNFEPIPCTDSVSVWRHCERRTEAGPVVELRRIPYRRVGMAVLNSAKLSLPERDLLFKVREYNCAMHVQQGSGTIDSNGLQWLYLPSDVVLTSSPVEISARSCPTRWCGHSIGSDE